MGVVRFAGVRKLKGSCLCICKRIPRGVRRLSIGLSRERFKTNSSKVVCVSPSRITSFGVQVFGTSNSRTGVYKGNVHYIKGCMCSGKCASGARLRVRALSKVGGLGLSVSGNGIGSISMGVKGTIISRSLSLRMKLASVMYAPMSVNGPRTMIFISGVSGTPLLRFNPKVRQGSIFPSNMGTRFMRMVSRGALHVHI